MTYPVAHLEGVQKYLLEFLIGSFLIGLQLGSLGQVNRIPDPESEC